jgi:hypothetical protein
MSPEKFLNFLKNRESYRKFVDQEANKTMNKISVTEPKGDTLGMTKLGFIFYPRNLLKDKTDDTQPTGFRIVDSDVSFENKEVKFEKSKTLIILTVHNNQEWWTKRINYGKEIRSIGFQFVDLDEDEYEFIKSYEEKLIKNDSKLNDVWGDFITDKHNALFDTEKRKTYPINRFQSYVAFEE